MHETLDIALNTVFETIDGSISQCDDRGVLLIDIFGEVIELRLCGFLALRRKINGMDVSELFSSERVDVELVYSPHCDRLFALSAIELLALKELMNGAMTILTLNSLIHRQTIRRPSYYTSCSSVAN